MKRNKPRYRVIRIQDLKPCDVVYDVEHNRHLMVLMPGVYQEGHLQSIPVWKFRYAVYGKMQPARTTAVAWLLEGSTVFIRVRDLNFNVNPF